MKHPAKINKILHKYSIICLITAAARRYFRCNFNHHIKKHKLARSKTKIYYYGKLKIRFGHEKILKLNNVEVD